MLIFFPPEVTVASADLSRDMVASLTSPLYSWSWNQRRSELASSGDHRTVSSLGWMYGSDSSTVPLSTQEASIQPERRRKPGSSHAVNRFGSVKPVPW